MSQQGNLTRGVYHFEDPSGSLLAARIPHGGPADLYDGTAVIVGPNQKALFVHKGEPADLYGPGTHSLKSENVPVLTRLSNWRFGFESPLKSELWFFSTSLFAGRRWGTASPVMINIESMGTIPIRGYGNYTIRIRDPRAFFKCLVGSRTSLDISELDDILQGQILELLPQALAGIKEAKDLSSKQDEISEKLENLFNRKIQAAYGLECVTIQVLSLLPPPEILKAIDERQAMNIIGDPREYLLYKLAGSLEHLKGGGSGQDTPLLMTMMMGKGMMGLDYHDKERKTPALLQGRSCPACRKGVDSAAKFCPDCGVKIPGGPGNTPGNSEENQP